MEQRGISQVVRLGIVILAIGLSRLAFFGAIVMPESDIPFERWYGNWPAVLGSTAVFLFFIFFLTRPRVPRDWRGTSLTAAFFISLFTEMFGIPLTIYLLAPILGLRPEAFGMHRSHLWAYLISQTGLLKLPAAVYLVMAFSTALLFLGVTLVALGWKEIYRGEGVLVTDGVYAKLRHPQYLGLILIVVAFLVMWPTFLTVLLAPFLIGRYALLAKEEDKELEEKFGDAFRRYQERVPAFIPSLQ